jgi:hypothetical protein
MSMLSTTNIAGNSAHSALSSMGQLKLEWWLARGKGGLDVLIQYSKKAAGLPLAVELVTTIVGTIVIVVRLRSPN